MEIIEPIENINQRLVDYYGIDISTGEANWRVVFSEDIFEKRLTDRTKDGFELLTPQMVELPKYKQWIHKKYLLEMLMIVPSVNTNELVNKTTYECAWVFEDGSGNYLPPNWLACKIVIESVLEKVNGRKGGMKYRDPEFTPEESIEAQAKRIEEIEAALYGNETDIGDALATGNAVGYTGKGN